MSSSSPGEELAAGHVFNSNGYALGALVSRTGGDIRFCGIAARFGRPTARSPLEQSDLVVTTGGASRGAYDIVSQIGSSDWPVEPLAVRMRPGKQLVLGWLPARSPAPERLIPFIGLPGNPVAAMVGFELFVRPAIMRMRGFIDVEPSTVTAIAEEDFPNKADAVSFLRVRISSRGGRYYASSGDAGRSHGLSSLLGATGLAEIPADRGVREGERVRVRLTGWSGLALHPPDTSPAPPE